MNGLSWLLYFGDALPKISVAILIVSSVATLVYSMYALEKFTSDQEVSFYPALLIITSFLLACAIPSKDTIYLIAGSEIGEQVVTSEAGQEVLNDIHSVIKAQLNQLKGED